MLNNYIDVEEATKQIEKRETKLKFQAFGKCSIRGKQGGGFQSNSIHGEVRDCAPNQQSENTLLEEVSQSPFGRQDLTVPQPSRLCELTEMEDILARQTIRLEKEIKKIKDGGKGRCGQIFKIAQLVQGPKKPGPEAHSVKDPETGELVVSTKAIQNVFLKHCKEVLKSNSIERGYEEEAEMKEKLNEIRMKESTGKFEATKEGVERGIEKFQKNNKRNYDFLVKGRGKFQHSMFLLVKRMISEERFSKGFGDTTLYSIYKGKGRRKIWNQ